MKKLLALALAFTLILSLSACRGDANENGLPKNETDGQNNGKVIEGEIQTGNIETNTEPQQSVDVGYPTFALIDSASFDIDDDGVCEECSMSYGPTSGLFTVVFTASLEGTIKYKNTFSLSWGELSFREKDGVTYFVRGDEYHRIFVDNNRIVIEDLDPQYEYYWGDSDWNYDLR